MYIIYVYIYIYLYEYVYIYISNIYTHTWAKLWETLLDWPLFVWSADFHLVSPSSERNCKTGGLEPRMWFCLKGMALPFSQLENRITNEHDGKPPLGWTLYGIAHFWDIVMGFWHVSCRQICFERYEIGSNSRRHTLPQKARRWNGFINDVGNFFIK